jgi:geranylgeranyl diphosphate synthase type II
MIDEIRSLFVHYGSIDFARAYAGGIASAAEEAFDEAFATAMPGPDMAFVRALIPYMLGRRS